MTKKSRTRAARERRQKEQRRNQQRLIVVGIVAVAIVVVALIAVSAQPAEAFIPEDIADKYEDIQRSSSIEGYPRLGDPDAPVTVEEFSSFSCPACEAFHGDSLSAILDRVRTGQVLFTYIPLQTGSIPNAEGSARAALCAGQQGQFWEMHDILFDWHTRYVNTAFSQSRLLAGVEALGMSSDSFLSCFNSQPINDTLTSAIEEGVGRTPTIVVNGVTLIPEQADSIPSTQEVLRAIDSATPSDWQPGMTEPDEVEETPDEDVEADDNADAQAEESDTTESEADEATESDEGEMTEGDMDESTESDMDNATESDGNDETESEAGEMTENDTDEPTESDMDNATESDDMTESDMDESTESDVDDVTESEADDIGDMSDETDEMDMGTMPTFWQQIVATTDLIGTNPMDMSDEADNMTESDVDDVTESDDMGDMSDETDEMDMDPMPTFWQQIVATTDLIGTNPMDMSDESGD